MHKSFWLGTQLKDFLFKGYTITSLWGLLATCLGVACLAILYEGGRVCRLAWKSRPHMLTNIEGEIDVAHGTTTPVTSCSGSQSSRTKTGSRISMAAKYALLCAGHDFMGYILMLSVMTLNFGLAFAIWFGAGLGYFVFGANISTPVLAERSSQCVSGREREKDLISRSCEEEIIGGEGAGDTRRPSLDTRSQGTNDLREKFSAQCDPNQATILTSQALVHREPSP